MIATDSLERLYAGAEAAAARPLRPMVEGAVPPRPHPEAVPHVRHRPVLEAIGARRSEPAA